MYVLPVGVVEVLAVQTTHRQRQREAHQVQGAKGKVAHGRGEEAHDGRPRCQLKYGVRWRTACGRKTNRWLVDGVEKCKGEEGEYLRGTAKGFGYLSR